jgi:hypothetical protein
VFYTVDTTASSGQVISYQTPVRRVRRWVTGRRVLLVALAVPLLYVGGWLGLVSSTTETLMSDGGDVVIYRDSPPLFGVAIIRVVFFPALAADRRIRPKYWNDQASFESVFGKGTILLPTD